MAIEKCLLNLDRGKRELQPHGTFAFPCAAYASEHTDAPQGTIPWHWHEDMEVIYVVSGDMRLQIPGKTFHLKAGEGIFINSNILHYAQGDPRCEIHSLVFHPRLITGEEQSVFAKRYVNPLQKFSILDGCLFEADGAWKQAVTKEIETAFQAVKHEDWGYEFQVREKLSEICVALCRQYAGELGKEYAEEDPDSIRIRKMMNYIHKHYGESLELSEIADAAGIGERECLRCFQRVIQISPIQYMIKYRIRQGAAMLLENLDQSVADIAMQCGFDSPSNFSQMFKRFYGCTPREYKIKNNTKI